MSYDAQRPLTIGADRSSYVVEKILGHDFAKNVRIIIPSRIALSQTELP